MNPAIDFALGVLVGASIVAVWWYATVLERRQS